MFNLKFCTFVILLTSYSKKNYLPNCSKLCLKLFTIITDVLLTIFGLP